LLALSEKYHLAPEWWLDHPPAWIAEARKQIMVSSRVSQMMDTERQQVSSLDGYAQSLGGGNAMKLITGADV